MPRKTFPCDVQTAHDRQDKRQTDNEIPHANVEALLPAALLEDLPIDFPSLMAEVARIHPRAVSWVEAKLEGLTDVELAAEWGMTPQGVMRWTYGYGLRIKAVFAEYLGMPPVSADGICDTHRRLMTKAA